MGLRKVGVRIFARQGDLGTRSDDCWRALETVNAEDPDLFLFGNVPVRIERKGGEAKTAVLDVPKMRHALVRVVDFVTTTVTAKGKVKAAPPQRELVEDVLANPYPPLPSLNRVTEVPVIAPDGSIQTKPGYHPASGTYYAAMKSFTLPDVPEHPTKADINGARTVIFEMLGEFPFVSFSDLAHAIALLVLPMVRDLIEGPTPIHVVEKPTPGTGAGLLSHCLTYPALGRALPVGVEADNTETRKKITAKLVTSPMYFTIDNVHARITSSALSAAVTAQVWDDRILGVTREVHLPVRCIWIYTGNNPSATIDNARRMIRIRIDAGLERPELRSGWRIPDLTGWVRENRMRIAHAVLTIAKAWIDAGRPAGSNPALGSFEEWSRTIGGILEIAGIGGVFLGNIQEHFTNITDTESAPAFISAWWDKFKSASKTVNELTEVFNGLGAMSAKDIAREAGFRPDADASTSSILGYVLRSWRDRVIAGYAIRRVGEDRNHKVLWALAPTGAGDAGDRSSSQGISEIPRRANSSPANASRRYVDVRHPPRKKTTRRPTPTPGDHP